jgi:subtilisin family serine protease
MISRKALGLLIGLSVSFGAQAATTKYLVKFKSPETFQMVAQNMKAQAFVSPMGQSAPMRLFNTNAGVSEALEHVQLLIVESSDPRAIDSIRNHPAVEMVEKEIMHPAPKIMLTRSAQPSLAARSPRIDRPWGIDMVKAPDAWNTTQGSAVRVMVLDTGVDQNHPALKGQFDAGKNFTGGSANDFKDDVGHGTHVAGTILGAGTNGSVVGVAPKARLLMGKVCSTIGCPSTAIAAGINWAVAEKVDVVNMSLGGSYISAGEKQALAAAEAAGVFIAAASGNDGVGRVSFPAAIDTVSAVGAIEETKTKAQFSQWGPELDVVAPGVNVISAVPMGTGRGATVKVDAGKGLTEVKSAPMVGSPVRKISGTMVYAGLGKTTDVANLDLTGKIAFISRGEIPFKEKLANALSKGAIAMVVFNNVPGLLQGALTEDGSEASIPAVMIEQILGDEVKTVLIGGGSATVDFSIDATDYASFQGTSMASPHVAGVAALIRGANKNLTPKQIREILKSTATALGPNPNNEYGSGLVNANAAVQKALTSAPVYQLAN